MGSDRPHEGAELARYRKYNNDLGYYLDAKRVRYAKKLNTGGTVEAEKWETGSEQDSVVWRYARTIGYVPTSATERKDIVEDPSFLPEYLRGYASSAYSSSTIQNFGIFETYCMKWLPRRDYTKHLFALNEQMEALDAGVVNLRDVQRIKFVAPDEAIIVSFCDYLKSRQDKNTSSCDDDDASDHDASADHNSASRRYTTINQTKNCWRSTYSKQSAYWNQWGAKYKMCFCRSHRTA